MVRACMAGMRETRDRIAGLGCGARQPVASASRVSMDASNARVSAPVPVGGQHVQLGDEYYVLASSLASRRRKHVLAHGDTFAVLDHSGDIPFAVNEELGLYFR